MLVLVVQWHLRPWNNILAYTFRQILSRPWVDDEVFWLWLDCI